MPRRYKTKKRKTYKKTQKKYKKKRGEKRKKTKKRKSSRRSIKKIRNDKCAPRNKNEILDFTCYTPDSLHKIKNIWNKKHPDSKITSNNPKTIWENLTYIFRNVCHKESCWLSHKCLTESLPNDIKKNTFRPQAPIEWQKNPSEWLSSIEISQVMKQYENIYKCFEFIGPSPIDYDEHLAYGECVWEELCKFNLANNIKRKKTKIGIIFNLDKHTKDGSHWVAMFINIKKKKIYYFDSYGENIPGRINKFANKVKSQANSLNMGKFELIINKKRHQYSNSECGMYSLYFIIQMLKTDDFNKFQKTKVKDSYMKKLRKQYFNH